MKSCTDKTIKDLLPAYREQGLDPQEIDRVRMHLESCGDCCAELSLLGLLAEESAPDPGEAFWLAMPERVHRAVREEKEKKRRFGLSLILDRFILPRWVWTAAAAGVVPSWHFRQKESVTEVVTPLVTARSVLTASAEWTCSHVPVMRFQSQMRVAYPAVGSPWPTHDSAISESLAIASAPRSKLTTCQFHARSLDVRSVTQYEPSAFVAEAMAAPPTGVPGISCVGMKAGKPELSHPADGA